jgi:hypothetical protein
VAAADIPTLNQNTTGSAATLSTGRTIAITGDLTYTSGSFNGSANVTGTGTLANSGVTAGTYTKVTVDAKGRVTVGASLIASDVPTLNQNTTGSAAVSTTATVTTSATASAFKVPFANTTASTTGNYGLLQDSEATFTYNPSTNTLVVGTVSGALSGNASTATTLQTARTINGVSFNGSADITVADATKLPLAGGTMTGAITFAAGQTWPTFNQSTTGNAATATALQTARTIGGVSFNGTANINLPGVNAAGTQNTSGTAAVSTAATVTTSATASAFKVPFANTTASTTGNYGLLQDSEGTFTYNPSTNTLVAGTFSGALSGNAATATALQTARTIGGVSFNGTANIDLPGVNAAGTQNTSGTAAVATAATITTSATASAFKVPFANTTASTTGNYGLLQDSEATFTYNPSTNTLVVGTVSAALSGNAATATALQTARAIGGVSFDGTANINLPGVNTAGNQNTTGSAATLTTGRTIAMTGDVAYTSGSFNGSANVTGTATLATVNSNVGSFGSASAIPVITVNAKGLVTAVSTATVAGGQYLGTAAVKAIAFNAQTIGENITIAANQNGLSSGPITINSGFTVTIASGGNWVVV